MELFQSVFLMYKVYSVLRQIFNEIKVILSSQIIFSLRQSLKMWSVGDFVPFYDLPICPWNKV